jgi:MoaA/NifB/PqqE/SkfB family radical SAM enzyme
MKYLRSLAARSIDSKIGEQIMHYAVGLLYHDKLRHALFRATGLVALLFVRSGRRHGRSARIDREREIFAMAVLETMDRLVSKRAMSRHSMEVAGSLWARALVGSEHNEARRQFLAEKGVEPPWVLVTAPTGACNLSCPGCYAGSSVTGPGMPFTELDRLLEEAKRLWGIKVAVFSGGEPLLYRSESKDVLDLIERHPDLLCLIFTNGTLIDRNVARRLAAIGTTTPALSVEGLEETTDARRGPGAFKKVMEAISELRDAGVQTGVSMTVTRDNCEEILSDEFLDFFFIENSMLYGFLFQYMPEGRNPDPTLMPTPEQRLWMWERTWEVMEKKGIFLIDFWHHGTLVGGCVGAGRERGYLYVDWDGNVMPCVFAPYVAGNIHEAHARGETLSDIWSSPLLARIREWQCLTTSRGALEGAGGAGQLVRACPIRDHYADFREMVLRSQAPPVSQSAGSCLSNPGFTQQMIDYGRDFADLSRPVLEAEYDGHRKLFEKSKLTGPWRPLPPKA